MTDQEGNAADGPAPGIKPGVAVAVGGGMVAVLAGAAVVFGLLRTPTPPPSAEVARDPLLLAGRGIYLDRCVSCHGPLGKGDGPIARGLSGPPVGNLTDREWKHGDRPEQVEAVIAEGVQNAAMPPWGSTLGPAGVRAVTAYVYHLAGRDVPPPLRAAPGQ